LQQFILQHTEWPVRCGCQTEVTCDVKHLRWQGIYIAVENKCPNCNAHDLYTLPVGQAQLKPLRLSVSSGALTDHENNPIPTSEWLITPLKAIVDPNNSPLQLKVETIKPYKKIIILNTVDFIFGHSYCFLLNIQRILRQKSDDVGLIVLVQPMLRWLVPSEGLAEIWTVPVKFSQAKQYFSQISDQINEQLKRFDSITISAQHIIPTNEVVDIAPFSKVNPFSFAQMPEKPRVSFVWREDHGRLWIKNIYLLKGMRILGLGQVLLPFHKWRVQRFMRKLKQKLGDQYRFTVTGFGHYGTFPDFIEDGRVNEFNEQSERKLCEYYAQSLLVVGIHGSSFLLPSAHAGMAISLMPSKRWGNYAEDMHFTEADPRLAVFQRRILPNNIDLSDLTDICKDMVLNRSYFLKKFVHSDVL
jgi:hypothetical protein